MRSLILMKFDNYDTISSIIRKVWWRSTLWSSHRAYLFMRHVTVILKLLVGLSAYDMYMRTTASARYLNTTRPKSINANCFMKDTYVKSPYSGGFQGTIIMKPWLLMSG